MEGADVRSIQAVQDLGAALHNFSVNTGEVLQTTEQEIARTLQWLASRRDYWARQERWLQEKAQKISRELQDLRNIPRESVHAPALGTINEYERTQRGTVAALEHARMKAMIAAHWHSTVTNAAANYQRQARRLSVILNVDVTKGIMNLRRKVDILNRYVASGVADGVGSGNPAHPPMFDTSTSFFAENETDKPLPLQSENEP